MKIDDGALNRYLIKNLQPLTEADPSLLANYVAALLKNNKPKKELQKLCIDQLYDFLGDGTKSFVAKLFQSLEDGTVPQPAGEEMEGKAVESGSAIPSGADVVELRTSPPHLERLPSTALRSFGEGEDDSSDDEDDDRNHKHRRRVSRSRSFDRDGEDEVDRGLYRKRGRAIDNGQIRHENERQGNERRVVGHALHNERDGLGKFDRRLGRDHGSVRFNADGGGQQRGGRSGPQFRDGPGPRFDGPNGMMRGNIGGRGRGAMGHAWGPHDQRFPPPSFPDGPEFAPALLPPGPGTGFFPGRGIPGRGAAHTPWPGFGPLPGLGNGPLEHSHPLSGGIGGGRGPPPISAALMNINMGRPRCLDFEERGYCLRGDLCPMEHGANRIVVEDVQSLSKFNLPVSIPSGRSLGGGSASGPSSGPTLPPVLALVNRTNHGSRETSLPAMGEDIVLLNGTIPGSAEPDSYDPDQPLWNKDRSEASAGLRTLSSFKQRSQDREWEGDSIDKRENREGSAGMDGTGTGRLVRLGANANGGSQISEGGPTVWDRIGPVVPVGSRLDGGLRTSASVELVHGGKPLKKDGGDEAVPRLRVPWQGKWNREVEPKDGSAPKGSSTTPVTHGRERGTGHGEAGAGQRSGEGTSYGARATGGRGGFGTTERAQRTLYVSFIPPDSNKTEQLLSHFQKFGEVLDIRIPAHSDRAFVQFSRRDDADAALIAPDAVMGNRFIRLSWANRDSIPDPVDHSTPKPTNLSVKPIAGISSGSSAVHTAKPSEKATMNGGGSAPVDLAISVDAPGKPVAGNGLSSTTPSAGVKKEELARMKDEIRKKQEALAQKRDDFRRKLDELAKGPGQDENLDAEQQPSKRQRLEDAAVSVSDAPQKTVSPSTVLTTEPLLAKTNSGDSLNNKQTVTPSVMVQQPPQPSPRSGRMPHGRMSSANISYGSPMTRGPARFKLDNRTTVFRVLPPFPASVMDVGVLKDHFVMFGELATVEVDDVEGSKLEGSTKLSETTSVRVSFATRRAAERAFAQGRWLQGQNLQLVWVNSTPTIPTSAVATQAESLVEKPSLPNQKSISVGLPSNPEQKEMNSSRSLDEAATGPVQEVLGVGGNAVGEEEGGGTDKKPSSTGYSLDWRRDTGLQVQNTGSKAGQGNVTSGPTQVAATVESSLGSEQTTGITNLE